MSEPINGVIKRIEDFRNKLVQHDADREVIKELDVLTTFLNEVVIKSLHYEHELWEEKVKLKEERSQMLAVELEEKKKDISALLIEKDKKVKELEWEVEKSEKEYLETSKNYKDRLSILSDENKVLGERVYQRENELKNSQVKKDQELDAIREEVAEIEEEMKKLLRERQALKDELEREKARAEELSRGLSDINKRYFEKIRLVNEENLMQQEKSERQYAVDFAKYRLKYEQELKNFKEEYEKLEERSREDQEKSEKERKKLLLENMRLKKAGENIAEKDDMDSADLNSMISEMNAKIISLKDENVRIKKEKEDVEKGIGVLKQVKDVQEKTAEEKVSEKISAGELLEKAEGLKKTFEKEIENVKEDLNLFWEIKIKKKDADYRDAMDLLARGFAHRLRNYIGIISGTIQLCVSQLETPVENADKSIVSSIKGVFAKKEKTPQEESILAVKKDLESVLLQIEDLTKAIKSFSELAKAPDVVKQELILSEVINTSMAFLKEKISDQKIDVKMDAAKMGIKLSGDKKIMCEIFNEAIQNAVEAMPNGGVLTIDSGFTAGEKGGVEQLEVKIIDSGIGIPEHVFPKVFQPFFTTKTGRDGLGLPKIKRDLLLLDGGLFVESKKGAGTTLRLMFGGVAKK